MPDQKQLAKIHIAYPEIGMSKKDYENTLSGWINVRTGKPVEHANELTDKQADELIETFKRLGWKPKRSSGSGSSSSLPAGQAGSSSSESKKRFEIKLPENRPDEFATQKQMNMLIGLWVYKSELKTEESFRKFVVRIVGYLVETLQKKDVQKVRMAIINLKPLQRKNDG